MLFLKKVTFFMPLEKGIILFELLEGREALGLSSFFSTNLL